MGWLLRIFAALVCVSAFGLGAWPVSLLALVYLAYSFRGSRGTRQAPPVESTLPARNRPWGMYSLGGALLLLSAVAMASGGTYSPIVLSLCGLAVLLRPLLGTNGLWSQVVPIRDSVLLRNRFLPFRWYAAADVKLESQGQTRGLTALEGELLVFAGRVPSALLVVEVGSISYRGAEEKLVRRLRMDTRALSQRGAHLLPLDSGEAAERLSPALRRLNMGTGGLKAASSLPFDVLALRAKGGLVVSQRAFRATGEGGRAAIPRPDIPVSRPPLLAEVVEEIGESQGWPAPDEYSPFLAAMDASRTEPLADRIRTKGGADGMVAVATLTGTEVTLTRAQLRTVARVYG